MRSVLGSAAGPQGRWDLPSAAAAQIQALSGLCPPPQLYQPLRLRVALIGLEVWNHRDKITVSPNPEVTLDNFLHWRESELLRKKPHDNAQLIT